MRRTVALLLTVPVLTAALVWPAFLHAYIVWSTTEEFSFGFLVVPVVVGLLWWQRRSITQAAHDPRGARSGLLLLVPSLGVYLAAARIDIHALAGVSVPPLLLGVVAYLFGWRLARTVAYPVGFLVFGLGLFRGLLDSVGFTLQASTASGAATLAHALGVAVVRDGLLLTSDRFAFIVAESCSGMSSLVSLLALATLWTYVSRGSLPARAAVICSALPLVVLANSTRVALVLLVASHFGQDAALGFFHGASSLVLFGTALAGLLVTSRLVGCRVFSSAPAY